MKAFPPPTHGSLEWTGGALEKHWGTYRCCLAVELQVIVGDEGDWARINLSLRHEPSEKAEVE